MVFKCVLLFLGDMIDKSIITNYRVPYTWMMRVKYVNELLFTFNLLDYYLNLMKSGNLLDLCNWSIKSYNRNSP